MELLFTKTGEKKYLFSCRRKDATVTWKHVSDFLIAHDLYHYVVEKELPLKNAFMGIVAAGTDIEEFDLPKEQRKIDLSPASFFAEHLVNLLLIDCTQGRMDNLVEVFTGIHDEQLNPDLFHLLTEEKLETIRNRYAALIQKWKSLPEGQPLVLLFEE